MRKTRIVCTLGPATGTRSTLERLVRGGMDVARLNMSHGSQTEHRNYLRALRSVSRKLNIPVAVLLDLQGIKIRISEVAEGGIVLEKGREVMLRSGRRTSREDTLYVSYGALVRDVRAGHRVLLDDGRVELTVIGSRGNALVARVKEGGYLTSHKGVNLPDSPITARPYTRKDQKDLRFGIREGVDAVALSFVTREGDVSLVRRRLREMGSNIPIIAKIEKPAAVDRIEAILDVSDGIMVARGDLGVELSPSAVPLIQKDLIRRANRKQRTVITATQMLESMVDSPVPTRAEAADVANAVLDGSDAVMLSGETAIGRYPVRTVRMMARIIEEVEGKGAPFEARSAVPEPVEGAAFDRTSFAVADAAVHAAVDVHARCIVAFTRSGYTAGLLAKFRPQVPIIAFTPDPAVINRMKLYRGVIPLYMRRLKSTDTLIAEVERALLQRRQAGRGDIVIVTASLPLNSIAKTNFLKVHRMSTGS